MKDQIMSICVRDMLDWRPVHEARVIHVMWDDQIFEIYPAENQAPGSHATKGLVVRTIEHPLTVTPVAANQVVVSKMTTED